VHLVGFITKKFVTLHGHMNVKKNLHLICKFEDYVFRVIRLCTVLGFVLKFSRLWIRRMGRLLLICWRNILSSP